MRYAVALALCAAIVPAAPAAAQGVFNPGTLTVSLGMDVNTQAEERRARTGRFDTPTHRRAAPARVNLTYRPNAALRQKNFARIVADARRIDPDGATKLAEALADGSLIGKVKVALAQYGMSTNNVADAVSLYLAFAWLATRASDRDPTRAEMLGLRNQIARAMAMNPAFVGASDAAKQQLAEANLVQGALVGQFANVANRDPAIRTKVRALVAQGAKAAYGFDLLSLNLTAQGLRP